MNTFHGMRVIESIYLTQSGEPQVIRRTWWARLFTRPWRPFQATYTFVPQVPYRGVVKLNEHTLVVHPAMTEELRKL